ncbi:unnamed protein product [Scytosiphon promiscuus]
MGKKTNSKTAAAKQKDPSPASAGSVAAHSTSKRPRSTEDVRVGSKKVAPHATGGGDGGKEGDGPPQEEEEELVFEDPFGDEFDPEDVDAINAQQEEGGGDDDDDEAAAGTGSGGAMDVIPEGDADAAAEEPAPQETKVWRAGVDELEEGDELEYDSTAYHMYHSLRPEWPCLSFDVIRDSLGTNRSRYPHTVFAVAGTQADRADNNRLQVRTESCIAKLDALSQLSGIEDLSLPALKIFPKHSRDLQPDQPQHDLEYAGGVNRVRSMPQRPGVVATWSETSDVHVWDLEEQVSALAAKGAPRKSKVEPVFTFDGHMEEGFALDWSPTEEGRLVTGDCGNSVYLTQAIEGGWATDPVPFVGHVGSVEDLQWSPTEKTVFASASADKTVAVWDLRKKNGSMLSLKAHEEDVNVISWNRNVTYLLASGSDDGSFKIWDLRSFGSGEPVAQFRWHKGPITSIEWHPTDESMLAASGADNQLTVWDLSVEADDEAAAGGAGGAAAAGGGGLKDLPPQLLFIHQGQTDIKELHFHPQIPGVIMSTAADGFNVFKPATTV